MNLSSEQPIRAWFRGAQRILLVTGAGFSTGSGISDFRSPGGIWERYRPVPIQEFFASREARIRYWRYKIETREEFAGAAPNEAHRSLIELQKDGRLLGVLTQNVDGLHQKAGIAEERVIEFHGSNARVGCLDCGEEAGWDSALKQWESGHRPPTCRTCGGWLKPRTISFGQEIPVVLMERARRWARSCDFCVVVGTSLSVAPASEYPRIAQKMGARVLILNRTPISGVQWADRIVLGEAEERLPRWIRDAVSGPDSKEQKNS